MWARQANKFRDWGGKGKMDDGKKEFLFSCHPLKRREDSASHRERPSRRGGGDWGELSGWGDGSAISCRSATEWTTTG